MNTHNVNLQDHAARARLLETMSIRERAFIEDALTIAQTRFKGMGRPGAVELAHKLGQFLAEHEITQSEIDHERAHKM